MSHFSVAVITKGIPTGEQIEKLMAPYQENSIGDCPKEYLEFVKTDKEEGEWSEEAQDYGYYENPNSKWDWYQVGGRWAGLLTTRKGAPHENGKKSWTWNDKNPYESKGDIIKCDSARIKDLVFLDKDKDAQRARRFWELYIEGDDPQNDEERDMINFVWYKKEYYTETYKDKETYVRCESAFSTYAVITKDGEWHAKGEMGWFGCSNDNDVVAWYDGYQKLVFDNAEDDDYLTIVDCHI